MTKLRNARGSDGKRILHWCPGCNEVHSYRVSGEADSRPMWSFNGDYERPTLLPSMLIFDVYDDEGNKLPDGQRRTICHYYIKEGRIEFCGDSPHALAGQTVELPAWPYAPGTYGGIDECWLSR